MKPSTMHAMMAAAFAAAFLVACGPKAENNEEGVLEQAGAQADEALGEAQEGAEALADEAGEAAGAAGEAINDAAEATGDAVGDAAEAAHGLPEGEQVEPDEAPK